LNPSNGTVREGVEAVTRQQEGDEAVPAMCECGHAAISHVLSSKTGKSYCRACNCKDFDWKLPATLQPEDEITLPATVGYKYRSDDEIKKAIAIICIGGKDVGISFFKRHPELGFNVAVAVQADLTDREGQLLDALRELRTITAAHAKEVMLHAVTKFERDALKAENHTLRNSESWDESKLKSRVKELQAQLDAVVGQETATKGDSNG
jgi:hypothetical protein